MATTIPRSNAEQLVRRAMVPPLTAARRATSAAIGAATGGGLFLLTYRGLVDDAYITLAFAKNLGLHGEWAVTPGLISNTATSPLWMLILGGITAIVQRPVVALGIAMLACGALSLCQPDHALAIMRV